MFAQLAHEMLGVPFEQIRYVQGDTAQVQIGRGTYGARSMVVGGNALKVAADAMIEKGKKLAAAMMEADAGDIDFKDGTFVVTGTDKKITLVDVAKASYAPMGPLTDKFGIGLDATGSFDPTPPSHPNGSHVCRARGRSGDRRRSRSTAIFVIDDLGRILNPMIVNGQQQGGVVQGIGQALLEHQVYDRQSGQLLTGSFMDYAMPHAAADAERRLRAGGDPLQDQSARREGHRRKRHHRRAADHHQRADRRARAARRRPDRHAGDAAAGVGDDPEGEKEQGSLNAPAREFRSIQSWVALRSIASRRIRQFLPRDAFASRMLFGMRPKVNRRAAKKSRRAFVFHPERHFSFINNRLRKKSERCLRRYVLFSSFQRRTSHA